MTSGCKVGVLIPELLGTLCGCPRRCLWAAFWELFSIPLCDVAGLVSEDHHSTQGFVLIVILGSFSDTQTDSGIRTLAPRYYRKKHAAFVSFHFLDVCRHMLSFGDCRSDKVPSLALDEALRP